MEKIKYAVAEHCGGLKECLATEIIISKETFDLLITSGLYEFYGYDERIGANRYLIIDMKHLYFFPSWLHEYV